jgi:1-acyl-sn-glycerol-3-phosphate acyltransferase
MKSLIQCLRVLFFVLVRFLALILLGLNVRGRHLLPTKGPAIIVANHNSHLDTLVLMSLFPLWLLRSIRPVAAADYFLKSRFMAWFATNIIGVIAIERNNNGTRADPLQPCYEALNRGEIIILFPEGTRGVPEQLSEFKAGIAHLAERFPAVPITPIFLYGLGKALPKNEFLLIPFFCDIIIGETMRFQLDRGAFMNALSSRFRVLADEGGFSAWE